MENQKRQKQPSVKNVKFVYSYKLDNYQTDNLQEFFTRFHQFGERLINDNKQVLNNEISVFLN